MGAGGSGSICQVRMYELSPARRPMQGWTSVIFMLLSCGISLAAKPENPVAVVEAVQIVGVEAVAEIGADAHRQRAGAGPEPFPDRRRAVGVLPRRLDSLLKLLDAHLRRPEDHVLAVVELPVAGEDAPLALQAVEQGRAGERRHHGEAWEVDPRLDGEAGCLQEDLRSVMVQSEDEAALEGDAVAVESGHQLFVALRRVETFFRIPQVLPRDGFEAHQNPLAAALL